MPYWREFCLGGGKFYVILACIITSHHTAIMEPYFNTGFHSVTAKKSHPFLAKVTDYSAL